MSESESIPAAWLRKFPPDYRLPLWRWLVLPATTILAHRNGGIWISGNLQASESGLDFAPTRVAAVNRMAASWSLKWDEILGLDFVQGMALDKIELRDREGGIITLRCARSAPFFEKVQSALSTVRIGEEA